MLNFRIRLRLIIKPRLQVNQPIFSCRLHFHPWYDKFVASLVMSRDCATLYGEHDLQMIKFIRRIFAKNKVHSILDCSCGTGRHLDLFHSPGVGSLVSTSTNLKISSGDNRDIGLRLYQCRSGVSSEARAACKPWRESPAAARKSSPDASRRSK